jgi:regulator of protease activity HflC (stomatin/prohibitin superfamily)
MLLELFTIAAGVTLVVGLVTLYHCFIVVREGEVIVVETMGKFNSVKTAGMHLIRPFIDAPRRVRWTRRVETRRSNGAVTVEDEVFDDCRIRTQNLVFDIPPVRCYTKEKLQLDVNIVVFYGIGDVQKAVYNVDDLHNALYLKVQSLLSGLIYDMAIDDITTQALQVALQQRLAGETWPEAWGLRVEHFDVQEVTLPEAMRRSTLDSLTQRRAMETERLTHEAQRAKQLSQLDMEAEVNGKKRTAEIAAMQHQIERTRLENEYENEKSRKAVETQNVNVKSQQQIECERRPSLASASSTLSSGSARSR